MDHLDRPRRLLAVHLAMLAGLVDAAGFLSAHGYFVSFMSGNTTRLAVNIVTDPAKAQTPALLIAGFVAGVTGGGLLARRGERWRKPRALGAVTTLLAMAALLQGPLSAHANAIAAPVVLAITMGALNTTFQRDGGPAIGLTYMTGALVRLGNALSAWLSGERANGWLSAFGLWFGLLMGAIVGAMAWTWIGGVTDWLACGVAAVLTLAAWLIRRGEIADEAAPDMI